MLGALHFKARRSGSPPALGNLEDSSFLAKMVDEYFQQYMVFIAREGLMEDVSLPSTGVATVVSDRLVVRSGPIHILTGILGLCLILSVTAIFFVPKKGFLPRTPDSILSKATLLAHSKSLLQALRGTGAAETRTLRDRLKGSEYSIGVESYERTADNGLGYFKIYGGNPAERGNLAELGKRGHYQPLALSPAARVLGILTLAGMIAGLEVLLRESTAANGFIDIRDDGWYHLLWTASGPALLLGFVAIYFAAVDTSVRGLAPYAALKRGCVFHRSIAMDYLDKSLPRVLHNSFTARNFTVMVSALAVALAATLTIFSASLFSAVSVPLSADLSIPTADFFATTVTEPSTKVLTANSATDALTVSLILGANFSFPPFTFEDLVFQTLGLEAPPEEVSPLDQETEGANDPEELVVSVNIPALRPKMMCHLFSSGDVATNLTLDNYEIRGNRNPLRIDVPGEQCFSSGGDLETSNAIISTLPGNGTTSSSSTEPLQFGLSLAARGISQCSDWLYVWGTVANAGTNDTAVSNVGVFACNETVEAVTVTVNFHGRNFEIRPEDPPVVDESSATTLGGEGFSSVELEPLAYESLVKVSGADLLDPFFSLLVNSRYAVPIESLSSSNEAAMQAVANGILKHHGIFRAQSLNSNHRVSSTTTTMSITSDATTQSNLTNAMDSPSTIPASVRSSTALSGLRRLEQDPLTTRILQALLSAILLLSLTSWIISPSCKLPARRPPHAIASIASLLADGNIFGFLPRGAEWMTEAEIKPCFMDGSRTMSFKMGWEAVRRRGRRRDRPMADDGRQGEAYAIRVLRTGGWGGGEEAGMGILARVAMGHRRFVKGWRE